MILFIKRIKVFMTSYISDILSWIAIVSLKYKLLVYTAIGITVL